MPAIPGQVHKREFKVGQKLNDVQITVCPPAQCCKRQGWMVQTNVKDERLGAVSKTVFADVPPIGRGIRMQDHLEMSTNFLQYDMYKYNADSESPLSNTRAVSL